MSFMCNNNLRIAYDRSDEILKNIQYSPDQMIDSNLILDYVRRRYCPVIDLYTMSFTEVHSTNVPLNSAAMMRVVFDNGLKAAVIVLNSDMSAAFQRFSLMQQIGHLVTLPENAQVNPDNFHVSTRINYDLTGITEEELNNNYYLLREQVANIFALRILMPNEQFFRKMGELGSVQAAANFFGVTTDAVISRMMIGA